MIECFSDLEYNRESNKLVFVDTKDIPDDVYWLYTSEEIYEVYNIDVRHNIGLLQMFVKRHKGLLLPKREEVNVKELTEWEETVLDTANQLFEQNGYFRIREVLENLSYSFARLENKEKKVANLLRDHGYFKKTKRINNVPLKVWSK
jgi:hypothetical protein